MKTRNGEAGMIKKASIFMLAFIMVISSVVCLMPQLSTPVYADGTYSYIDRYWDWSNSQLVSKTKTASCNVINQHIGEISGWWVADSDVTIKKRVKVIGEANLILCDGVTLDCDYGITVPSDATLNIYCQEGGSGTLLCRVANADQLAAIGSGDEEGDCGTVNIYGGNIRAGLFNGGKYGAGIGGGDQGGGGAVTIYGGTVTAAGGNQAAGIGGGDKGNGGTTIIFGGTVSARGCYGGAGIGGGDGGHGGTTYIYDGTVNANGSVASDIGSKGGAGIGGGGGGSAGETTIYGGTVNANIGVDSEGAGIGTGGKGSGGKIIIRGGNITAQGGEYAAGIGGGDQGYANFIQILSGTVKATGGSYGAGIGTGDECTSTEGLISIGGGADVTATGGKDAAGIGGGNESSGGTILIGGGKVVATGGSLGAGIGGGDDAKAYKIEISSGTVEATGGSGAAGIGGGDGGSSASGDITILGGDVTAKGGDEAAGIGNGNQGDKNNIGTITISGGTVKAYGGTKYGAGIGGGDEGGAGKIIISGGEVTAQGGTKAAGIGSGYESEFGGNIYFDGGHVTVISNNEETAIGSSLTTDTDHMFVEFNGATVLKKTDQGSLKPMVRAVSVLITENDTLHQSVSYFDGSGAYESDSPSKIALKDERVNYITSNTAPYVLVGPCDHRNSQCTDYVQNHARHCPNCNLGTVFEDHTYEKTYTWKSDNSFVTGVATCAGCGRSVNEGVATTSEVNKQATCIAKGETTYTATFSIPELDKQTKTVADIDIDPNNHDWGFNGFTWTGDSETGYTAATGNYTCKNDAEHTEEVSANLDIDKDEPSCTHTGSATYTATILKDDSLEGIEHTESKTVTLKELAHTPGDAVKENEVAATCTTGGSYDEVVRCTVCKQQLSSNHVVVSATGHNWGEWQAVKEPTETEDGEQKRVCQNDNSHVETQAIPHKDHVHVLSHVPQNNPSCTEAGNKEYWICDKGENPCNKYFEDAEGTTETTSDNLTIPAKGHTPGEAVIENEIEPSCTRSGGHDENTYCTVCNKLLTHEHKVDPAIDHKWGVPTYEWENVTEEKWKVTATRVCEHDAAHIETESVYATAEVTKEATETEEGETTYTATFTNSAFEPQTKTEPIPKLEPQEISYSNVEGDGSTWTKGSEVGDKFVFKRSIDDHKTFDEFVGIKVDGKEVDSSNYIATSGSVIIDLKPEYLETLEAGEHTLTAMFEDGNDVSVKFTILDKSTPPDDKPSVDPDDKKPTVDPDDKKPTVDPDDKKPTVDPTDTKPTVNQSDTKPSPNTSDSSNMSRWFAMMCVALAAIFIIFTRQRKRHM